MMPKAPKIISQTSVITLTMIEIQANILAFFAESAAPAASPAVASLLTCVAKYNDSKPCGRQQKISETTLATMARTMLLGTFGVPDCGGGGVHGCDIYWSPGK